jgi:hypothetical protein
MRRMVIDDFVVFVQGGQMRQERLASAFWRVDVTAGSQQLELFVNIRVHNT